MAGLEHRGNLAVGFGQHHDQRLRAVGSQAVTLIRHGVLGVPEQCVRGHQRRERGDDFALARGAVGSNVGGGGSSSGGGGQGGVHGDRMYRCRGTALCWAGKHCQHPGVAIQVVAGDLAGGKKADQWHVAERVLHDLRFG